MKPKRPMWQWIVRLAVIVLLAAGVGGGFWYYEHEVKPARHITVCKGHLKQLLTAIHNYHDEHKCFPPAYTLGPDGERWHSWRVMILPQLGEQELYTEYHLDEPWNGPRNAKLANRMPTVFGYPGEQHTKFLAVVGRHAAWPEYLSSSLRDFTDGTSNTIMLVESADSTLNWLEPRDLSIKETMKRQRGANGPRFVGRYESSLVGMGDGTSRSLKNSLPAKILGNLLTAGPTGEKLPADPKAEAAAAVFPQQRDASEFPNTDVLPYPSKPIKPGRNYLYCSTFRVAWDGLRSGPGEPVGVQPMPLMAAELNRLPFPFGSLDPESFLAMAVDSADVGRITAEMNRRFPGAPGPVTPPSPARGQGKVIYTYLIKSLPFATEFDSQTSPLPFPDNGKVAQVACFGRLAGNSANTEAPKQVRVADYRTDNDFILELKTESPRDVMLLAKVPPEATMQFTIDAVMRRIAKPNPQHTRFALEDPEDLLIPKLSLNILRKYEEVLGFQVGNRGGGEYIVDAQQATAFVLNERGAELESYSEISEVVGDLGDASPGEPPPPPKIRKFTFDRPFLVLLRETESQEPYFALWVENAELIEPFLP